MFFRVIKFADQIVTVSFAEAEADNDGDNVKRGLTGAENEHGNDVRLVISAFIFDSYGQS